MLASCYRQRPRRCSRCRLRHMPQVEPTSAIDERGSAFSPLAQRLAHRRCKSVPGPPTSRHTRAGSAHCAGSRPITAACRMASLSITRSVPDGLGLHRRLQRVRAALHATAGRARPAGTLECAGTYHSSLTVSRVCAAGVRSRSDRERSREIARSCLASSSRYNVCAAVWSRLSRVVHAPIWLDT